MLFNYKSGLKQILNRAGSYLPGQIADINYKKVESISSTFDDEPIEFGTVVKRVVDTNNIPTVQHIVADDSFTDFYGIAVRDVVTQNNLDISKFEAQIIHGYYAGQTISVMKCGYVSVPVQFGTPTPHTPVWVRVAPSLDNPNLPIGGIEAYGSLGCVRWKGATFESSSYFPVQGLNTQPTTKTGTSQCATIFIREVEYGLIPTVETAPIQSGTLTLGDSLADVVLENGAVTYNGTDVDGKFVMNQPTLVPPVGQHTYTASFVPDELDVYEIITNVEVTITVAE